MDWTSRAFLKASLCWLSLGVTLGVCMAIRPSLIIYRPAHVHMNLIGFVAMMIAGVAYHVVPRFTGHPLHNTRLAAVHWWVANVGLGIFVIGFVLRAQATPVGIILLPVGGTLSAAGMYMFAYNLWRTIDGRASWRAASERRTSRAAARPMRQLVTLED